MLEAASCHQLQLNKYHNPRDHHSTSLTELTGQFQEDGNAPSVPSARCCTLPSPSVSLEPVKQLALCSRTPIAPCRMLQTSAQRLMSCSKATALLHQHAAYLPALSILVPGWSSASATVQAAHVSSSAFISAEAQLNSRKSSPTSSLAPLLWSQQRQSFAAQVRQCSVLPYGCGSGFSDQINVHIDDAQSAAEVALEHCTATVEPAVPFPCLTGNMMWHSVQCIMVNVFHDGLLGMLRMSRHSTASAEAARVEAANPAGWCCGSNHQSPKSNLPGLSLVPCCCCWPHPCLTLEAAPTSCTNPLTLKEATTAKQSRDSCASPCPLQACPDSCIAPAGCRYLGLHTLKRLCLKAGGLPVSLQAAVPGSSGAGLSPRACTHSTTAPAGCNYRE